LWLRREHLLQSFLAKSGRSERGRGKGVWTGLLVDFLFWQELFAVETRATFNGLAAAAGKTGAVSGIWLFEKVNLIMARLWVVVVVVMMMVEVTKSKMMVLEVTLRILLLRSL
jgi:hypothetical protein